MVVNSLLFPADPTVWIKNMCEPGGEEAWIRAKKTTELAPWFAPDYDTHVKILKKTGYTGPLNWYKQVMAGVTFASEKRINPDHAATKFDIPALYIGCTKDYVCIPAFQEAGMKDSFSDFTSKSLDAGHWCMSEKPQETWDTIVEFIEEKQKAV
jgi:pimeloyl-ACP methyl ester carboxylesterase